MFVEQKSKRLFYQGIKRGLPVAIGYIPVSFTFGLMAVSGGLPVWLTILISFTNLTSAGQFAGTNLILAGAGFIEIAFTTFIINLRYMLMSLSLSQKIESNTKLWHRLIFSFGITDETFTVASLEPGKLNAFYMFGLVLLPACGWTLGTAFGALICSSLPISIANAMGIALYAMFIAIIVPPAKKSKPVFVIVGISIVVMLCFKYIHVFSFVSSGLKVILSTIIAASIGAILFPVIEDDKKS